MLLSGVIRRLGTSPSARQARGMATGVNPKGLKILSVLYPDPVSKSAAKTA
jgi:hypothetical protein